MDPSVYAQTVFSDSQISPSESRYSGGHFEGLARYLQRPYEVQAPHSRSRTQLSGENERFDFVSICNLDPSAPIRTQHTNSISDFEEGTDALKESKYGHILFLRGHPSPEWILSIGARYKVDPEFFRRHLDFLAGPRHAYSLPPLPSTGNASFKLRSTTIGASISTTQTNNKQSALDKFRVDNRAKLTAYRDKLRGSHDLGPGDSIVRESSIHDLRHFSIEQDISVYVTPYYKSWAGKESLSKYFLN